MKATTVNGIATWAVALLAAGLGGWGTYGANKALRLKEPLDEHEAMERSFQAEIASADARKDRADVSRLRVEYEGYEEHWRTLQAVAAIVAPITNLDASNVSSANAEALTKYMKELTADPVVARTAPLTMGAGLIALKQYGQATTFLTNDTKDPKALALRAAAFSGLASDTTDSKLKLDFQQTAIDSFRRSFNLSKGTQDQSHVTEFAQQDPTLSPLVPKANTG